VEARQIGVACAVYSCPLAADVNVLLQLSSQMLTLNRTLNLPLFVLRIPGCRDLLFVFLHDVATMERAGSPRPVPSPVVRRLLTERLVTVPPDSGSDKAAALFHAALQHVALKARVRVWSEFVVLVC